MNSTKCATCLSADQQKELFGKYIGYALTGLLLVVTNLTICFAIMRQKVFRIRKEYILISAVLFCNGLMGVAGVVGGTMRSLYIYFGVANQLKSRFQCFLTPYQQLWAWADILCPLMLALVSFDRVYAVAWPIKYYVLTSAYAWRVVGVGFGFTLCAWLTCGVTVLPYDTPMYPLLCSQSYSVAPGYHLFLKFSRLSCTVASIVFYFPVVLLYRRAKQKAVQNQNGNSKHSNLRRKIEAEKQQRLTISLGISALFTLLFLFLPMVVDMGLVVLSPSIRATYSVGTALQLLYHVDPLVDFFIFTIRDRQVRMATVYLFKWKELTQSRLNQNRAKIRVKPAA